MEKDQTSGGGWGSAGVVLNKMRAYILVVCLQFGMAGTYIISMVSLNHGMNRYVLITYRNAIAAVVIAPFALLLERKTRPKVTLPIFWRIMALGCLDPILCQGFAFLGMQYTSATFASAIMNAVPSITFVMALILRLESIRIKERRSQAKIVGTLVTLGGAMLMTLYKGPVIDLLVWSNNSKSKTTSHQSPNATASSPKHFLLGTLLLLVACVAWSGFYTLQSTTVKKFPAELTLTCLICLSGAVQTLVVALIVAHHPADWALGLDSRLLASVYLGVVSSGLAYYVQGVVMKTRGPVFVTSFNPLCMIIVAALGSVILAEQIHLGSIIGGIVIAIGLYSVVWGKSKDYASPVSSSATMKSDAQELPITTTNSAKLVIVENGN
ncbi:hypothetical protein Tsubulata_030833 [Turnera subulata]|uniref:WAT1-related protein n=1 Tax=Turnera subulata TaxID=218843 RepID=A0A9Q0GIJ2_9ROSI|nr:hypothetical protein Tsubulata_030833 [Turnera subulata]